MRVRVAFLKFDVHCRSNLLKPKTDGMLLPPCVLETSRLFHEDDLGHQLRQAGTVFALAQQQLEVQGSIGPLELSNKAKRKVFLNMSLPQMGPRYTNMS